MANVNIEKVVIAFLDANKATGFDVYGDMPDPRPEGFVLVDRTGGPRDNVVQDRSEMLIEVYQKDSRQDASDEAYRIADILPALLEVEAITTVKVNSVVKLDDLLGQYWRYQIYVDVYYRRGEIEGAIEIPIVPGSGVVSVNGKTGVVNLSAIDIPYDNSASGLSAEQIQAAVDELAARTGGSPDVAWEYIDLTGKIRANPPAAELVPAPIDGAGGAMYWHRDGREVKLMYCIVIPSTADWGAADPYFPVQTPFILAQDLPYEPRIYPPINDSAPVSNPGSFGLVNATADDHSYSFGEGIGSVVTDFGGSLQQTVLTHFLTSMTEANLSNLLYDGHNAVMIGNNVVIYCSIAYEAKEAA